MKQVSVKFDYETVEFLDREARRQHRGVAGLVRFLVAEGIRRLEAEERERRKKPRQASQAQQPTV